MLNGDSDRPRVDFGVESHRHRSLPDPLSGKRTANSLTPRGLCSALCYLLNSLKTLHKHRATNWRYKGLTIRRDLYFVGPARNRPTQRSETIPPHWRSAWQTWDIPMAAVWCPCPCPPRFRVPGIVAPPTFLGRNLPKVPFLVVEAGLSLWLSFLLSLLLLRLLLLLSPLAL